MRKTPKRWKPMENIFKGSLLLLLLAVAMFFHQPSVAQTNNMQNLTLEQAVELALKASEDLSIAQSDLLKADAQIREAWSAALPSFNASATSSRHLETPVLQFNGMNVPIKQDWELALGLEVRQVVWAFGRIGTALDLAKVSRTIREDGIEAAKLEVHRQVKTAYFGVKLADQILTSARQSLNNAKQTKRTLEQRFSGGRVPRFDNIKISSDIASRQPIVADAERQLELAWMQFNTLIGQPANTRWNLSTTMKETFPQYAEEDLVKKVLSTHPQLKMAQAGIEVAEKSKDLAEKERYPVLSFFGQASRSGTGPDITIGDENLTNAMTVGLNLTVPIWNGGREGARTRQAVQDAVNAELSARKAREGIELALRQAIASYRTNQSKLNAALESSRLAQQTYDLAQSQFRSGALTLKDLNDMEMALTSSQMQLASARFQVQESLIAIESFVQDMGAVQ